MTYHVHWAEVVCPHCRQELSESVGGADPELVCQGCQRRFPVICGIPDLRIFPDPYISFEGDRTKARMLFSRFRDLDFAGLVSLYYDVTPETPHKDVVLNTARLTHAVARSAATLEAFLRQFDLPVLTYLRDTQVYANAAFQGKSIFDLPHYLGERDIEDWKPLLKWLDK